MIKLRQNVTLSASSPELVLGPAYGFRIERRDFPGAAGTVATLVVKTENMNGQPGDSFVVDATETAWIYIPSGSRRIRLSTTSAAAIRFDLYWASEFGDEMAPRSPPIGRHNAPSPFSGVLLAGRRAEDAALTARGPSAVTIDGVVEFPAATVGVWAPDADNVAGRLMTVGSSRAYGVQVSTQDVNFVSVDFFSAWPCSTVTICASWTGAAPRALSFSPIDGLGAFLPSLALGNVPAGGSAYFTVGIGATATGGVTAAIPIVPTDHFYINAAASGAGTLSIVAWGR